MTLKGGLSKVSSSWLDDGFCGISTQSLAAEMKPRTLGAIIPMLTEINCNNQVDSEKSNYKKKDVEQLVHKLNNCIETMAITMLLALVVNKIFKMIKPKVSHTIAQLHKLVRGRTFFCLQNGGTWPVRSLEA